MRPDERVALREQFGFCCGYCGVSEVDVGAELHIRRLRLNRARLVANRRRRRLYAALRQAQATILEHLSREDQALQVVATALNQLGREDLPAE